MLENVSRGQTVKPKADDQNAIHVATRWALEQMHKKKEKPQTTFQYGNVVWVRNVDTEVSIPQFGFCRLKEPLFLPTDAETIRENHNAIRLKVDGNINPPSDNNWNFFTDYRHYGILLEAAPVHDEDYPDRSPLVECVIDGLCWCKSQYGGDAGDADSANHYPSTVWPRGNGSNYVGLALGGGPLQIVWRSPEVVDGDPDFNWTLVRVGAWMDEATFIMGTLDADVAKGGTADVTMTAGISGVFVVPVYFPFFNGKNDGSLIGAIWHAHTDTYVAIAKECP